MRSVGRTPSIELWGMGGLTHWGEGPQVSGWKNAAVSLAGPLAGFAVAVPFVIAWFADLAPSGSLASEVLDMVLWVNVGWGVLNLLPILPLDGGHVMEVAVIGAFGKRGHRLARLGSIVVAGIAAAAAISYGMEWAAFLAFLAGMQSFRELGAPPRDATIPATPKPQPELERAIDEAWDAIRNGRAPEAIEACEAKLAETDAAGEGDPVRARLLEMITPGSQVGEPLHLLSSIERRSKLWDTDVDAAQSALSAAISLPADGRPRPGACAKQGALAALGACRAASAHGPRFAAGRPCSRCRRAADYRDWRARDGCLHRPA